MLVGLMAGLIFFFIAVILAVWFYRLASPLYKIPFTVIWFSLIGHFLGTFAYSLTPHDSLYFFYGASPYFKAFGTSFVLNIVWFLRQYLLGDSYYAALYFSGAIAFLGSVLWFCIFVKLSQALKLNYERYWLPALVIMCWPSYLYFTTGLGKDSLCFFFIPLALLAWMQIFYSKRHIVIMTVLLCISLGLLVMIRPYLLVISGAAFYFATFKSIRHITILRLLSFIVLAPIVLVVVQWAVHQMANNLNVTNITQVAQTATMHQTFQSHGTYFPMLSYDPIIVLLSLPYSMLMNLIMPLFIFAHGMTGYIASLQNVALLCVIVFFCKHRQLYKNLKQQCPVIKFYFYFFLAGLAMLGLTNTNLGAAVRHKTMYVPILLIIAMCIWVARKRRA